MFWQRTPKLKELGIKTGSRLFEIPQRNDIYIINPSMRRYLEVSLEISKIALKYVPGKIYISIVLMNFYGCNK